MNATGGLTVPKHSDGTYHKLSVNIGDEDLLSHLLDKGEVKDEDVERWQELYGDAVTGFRIVWPLMKRYSRAKQLCDKMILASAVADGLIEKGAGMAQLAALKDA